MLQINDLVELRARLSSLPGTAIEALSRSLGPCTAALPTGVCRGTLQQTPVYCRCIHPVYCTHRFDVLLHASATQAGESVGGVQPKPALLASLLAAGEFLHTYKQHVHAAGLGSFLLPQHLQS